MKNESTVKRLATQYASDLIEVYLDEQMLDTKAFKKILCDISGKKYRNHVDARLGELVEKLQESSGGSHPKRFQRNVSMFCKAFKLPKSARGLVAFSVAITVNKGLRKLVAFLRDELNVEILEDISLTLGVDEKELFRLISKLVDIGMYCMNLKMYADEDEFLIIPETIAIALIEDDFTKPCDILASLVTPCGKSELTKIDVSHLDLTTMEAAIKKATSNAGMSLSILLYGAPGTGKTSLAKYLAQSAQSSLLKVQASGGDLLNPEGELNSRKSSAELRLQHFDLVGKLASQYKKTMLLVDECENIFEVGLFSKAYSKEILHSCVEEKPVVSIWITNHVDMLPDSVIRRFNIVYELPELSKSTRESIVSKHVRGLSVGKDFICRLTENPNIQPGHIVTASNLARLCEFKNQQARDCIETSIENTLKACGVPSKSVKYKEELKFNPSLINITSQEGVLKHIEQAVGEFGGSRSLLTGPPGTGKTAFVHHLCEKSGIKLISVRASDLLSKWVGESEQNIAATFKSATYQGSAIFLDEADSLLCPRQAAKANWEVQTINELLCQMEVFQLPLFAATNFAERLDQAVMRRFDFNLQFTYLKQSQVLHLFRQVMALRNVSREIVSRLRDYSMLTPGDFAIVQRRQFFARGTLGVEDALLILQQQHQLKNKKRTIGFH
ncbi:AAA family ATPase [Pseudoalteromonas pernae]|uniref:AAA family ATPase n=1 Tax=Pseudoalteromonas pernae TaxID=3118054 RepID=UPI003241C2F6